MLTIIYFYFCLNDVLGCGSTSSTATFNDIQDFVNSYESRSVRSEISDDDLEIVSSKSKKTVFDSELDCEKMGRFLGDFLDGGLRESFKNTWNYSESIFWTTLEDTETEGTFRYSNYEQADQLNVTGNDNSVNFVAYDASSETFIVLGPTDMAYHICTKDSLPEWTTWYEWTNCTAECGPGTHERFRECKTAGGVAGYCRDEADNIKKTVNFESELCEIRACEVKNYCANGTFDNAFVSCGLGEMNVTIPNCSFNSSESEKPYIGYAGGDEFEEQCFGLDNGDFTTFHINDDGCNTKVFSNNTHLIYSNYLTVINKLPNIISRQSTVHVDFSCAIDRSVIVSVKTDIISETLDDESEKSDVQVEIHLYDNNFENVVPLDTIFNSSEHVNVGISATKRGVWLQVRECWATPRPIQYMAIRNWLVQDCVANNTDTSKGVTTLLMNGQSNEVRMKLLSISFDAYKSDNIYIHCRADACEDDADCESKCSSITRHPHSDEYIEVNIGPIKTHN